MKTVRKQNFPSHHMGNIGKKFKFTTMQCKYCWQLQREYMKIMPREVKDKAVFNTLETVESNCSTGAQLPAS